jgi:PKD repeat protein
MRAARPVPLRRVLAALAPALCGAALMPTLAAATPPTASFTMDPSPAPVDEQVTFTDTSTDPDGDAIVQRGWDINGDGVVTDPSGPPQVSRPYHDPGQVTITLHVTDAAGETASVSHVLTVFDPTQNPAPGPDPAPDPMPTPTPTPAPTPAPPPAAPNRTPTAAFLFSPFAPVVGELVTFQSSSQDADGSLAAQTWDLDGDGQFGDAAGATVQTVYTTPGSRAVSLRVTDDRGASSVAFQSVTVSAGETGAPVGGAAQGAPATAAPTAAARRRTPLMTPFPIVRIRGQVVGAVVRLDVLSVAAPARATVTVSCAGRGCPAKQLTQRVGGHRRTVRFARLERRLRAGTVLRVAVTKPGTIGKYTRFILRRDAAPARRDLCLRDGARRPSACPAA